MKVVRDSVDPMYDILGPKGKKVLRDEAKRMGMELRLYCKWATTQPYGYLQNLLKDTLDEHGLRPDGSPKNRNDKQE